MEEEDHAVLCCECAVPIAPNPVNMCTNCMQARYDIAGGIAKQVQQNTCRGCERYERRDGTWAKCDIDSKELLALLLRKPRGLAAVRLVDASFIWVEPHCRRLKLKLCVQKEIVANAVLQQSFVVEYILGNKQCGSCQRKEAKDTWTSLVQVRQKVTHKRTFLWLEQLILKHRAHVDATNVVEMRDGIDFFFDTRSHAEKLSSFLSNVAPVRVKHSKQLISEDTHTGKGRYKFTYALEVLPICKDDVVWLPPPTAAAAGNIAQLALCNKVSNVLHFMDARTLQAAELQPLAYWKAPFKSALSRSQLIEFVVLDVEFERGWQQGREGRPQGQSTRQRRAAALQLAEVTVARVSDLGANDRTERAVSHLGNVLKAGDHVWGYAVAASSLGTDLDPDVARQLPEVLLVKKSFAGRRRRTKRRHWKLLQLDKEEDPGVQRGRKMDTGAHDHEYEQFLQDLEEDPEMRGQINMFKDEQGLAERGARAAGSDEEEEEGDNDDFPDVGLEELLDELTLGADDEDCEDEHGPLQGSFFAGEGSSAGAGTSDSAAPASAPFTMPGGSDVQFFF